MSASSCFSSLKAVSCICNLRTLNAVVKLSVVFLVTHTECGDEMYTSVSRSLPEDIEEYETWFCFASYRIQSAPISSKRICDT